MFTLMHFVCEVLLPVALNWWYCYFDVIVYFDSQLYYQSVAYVMQVQVDTRCWLVINVTQFIIILGNPLFFGFCSKGNQFQMMFFQGVLNK